MSSDSPSTAKVTRYTVMYTKQIHKKGGYKNEFLSRSEQLMIACVPWYRSQSLVRRLHTPSPLQLEVFPPLE